MLSFRGGSITSVSGPDRPPPGMMEDIGENDA